MLLKHSYLKENVKLFMIFEIDSTCKFKKKNLVQQVFTTSAIGAMLNNRGKHDLWFVLVCRGDAS